MWQPTPFELRYDQNNNNISLSQLLFNFLADLCYNYHNLSDANRKSSYVTPISGFSVMLSTTVCFSNRPTGCNYAIKISVQNCGSFYIYKIA